MLARDEFVTLLENAAARLERTGWQQHAAGPPEGPNCIGGAVAYQAQEQGLTPTHRNWNVMNRVAAGMGAARPLYTFWNDHTCQSLAEAADFLRLCAKEVAETEPVVE